MRISDWSSDVCSSDLPPVSIRDFALVALFSVAPALLISYPGMWVFSRLPNSVLIATDRIAVGREVTPFAQVQSAIVGPTRLGGVEPRIFTFRTKRSEEHTSDLQSPMRTT